MRFILMGCAGGGPAKVSDFNDALRKAGVLLAADSLFPASTAARISPDENGKPTVSAGAALVADAVTSYWIIQARSREEAIEWAKRAPIASGEAIEVRQIQETTR